MKVTQAVCCVLVDAHSAKLHEKKQFKTCAVYGLFTLPDTDSDPNVGTDISTRNRTVLIRDTSPDSDLNPSLCNVNIVCIVSHQVWNLNLRRYLNPCPAM